MSAVLLGVDLGTSSLKLAAVDLAGRVVAQASAEIPTITVRPGWEEQDPADWWTALVSAARRLLADEAMAGVPVAAIGFTGQMHAPVLLNAAGAALGRTLIWSDSRTADEVAQIETAVGRDHIIATTGSAPNASFTAAKLLWLRRHRPEEFGRARVALLPKDYLRYRLTGQILTDASDASATLLFDVSARRWAADVVDRLELDPNLLPPVVGSTDAGGELGPASAAQLGLRPGIPVFVGGGDAPAAALAAAVTGQTPTTALLTLGTSGQLLVADRTPHIDPNGRLHTFCHVVPERWTVMAAILSAGASLRWGQRLVGGDGSSTEQLLAEAAAAPVGGDGLLFTPYLSGERTPHMDPHAHATLVGLRAFHERGHVIRAIMEGVAFAFKDGLTALEEAGAKVALLRCTGGGARSELWCRILSSVLDRPLEVARHVHGSSYGAALLAGQGAGLICADDLVRPGEALTRYEPDPSIVDTYRTNYGRYREIYHAARPVAAP